ncbi:hypothetical protein [Mesobacillus campisalis]|nr:hypothetical protein [Mesobacillus campisalis]
MNLHGRFRSFNKTTKLVLGANLVGIAAVLQAAGGFLPGIGYVISPLATAPILLCSLFSIPFGFMSYLLTILLLLIIQPAELMIFPFTTGLLGLGIGASFSFFRKRLTVIAGGAIPLTLGIISLLYFFRFPILGPAFSGSFSILTAGGIFVFAFLYSWLWVEMALLLLKRISRFR